MTSNPFAAANFVKQRLANYQARRANGTGLGEWLVSGVSRYVGTYARRRRAGPAVRERLSRHTSLNFGCGYDKRAGHVNVDMDSACRPDVLISPALYDEFPTGHYQRIVAKDVLEHIPRPDTLAMLLRFNDWLAPGGVLELQTSSVLAIAEHFARERSFVHHHAYTTWLFGNQAHPGDFHFTGFTETTLKVHLLTAGFSFGDHRLANGWMFELEVRKERSWYRWDDGSSGAALAEEVFEDALGRAPSVDDTTAFIDRIGRVGRKQAALEIFARPQRMFDLAQRHGL